MDDGEAFLESPSSVARPNHDGIPAVPLQYTRSTVAAVLRVSVTTVRRWEGTLLHPTLSRDGTHLFDRTEVESLAQQRPVAPRDAVPVSPGEIAAAAFALFKKGVSPCEVVIELEQPPESIRKLHEEWERFANRLVLSEDVLIVLNRMSTASVIDDDIVLSILNNDAESLRSFLKDKLEARKRPHRDQRVRPE